MPSVLIVPSVASSSSAATGLSLQTYRRRLAETLGYFAYGSVTTQAASLEAETYILSSSMRSDGSPPEQFDGLFVYVTSGTEAGSQRKLVPSGWDGPLGALKVDYPYSSALAAGSGFEISVLPAARWQGLTGLNDIINEALEQLPVIDLISITITATSGVPDTQYSLAGYAWPIKKIRNVYYARTSTTSERRVPMPPVYDLVHNGELPVLSFRGLPATVGDVIEVEVLRPANTWIKQGTTWGSSSTGLSAESDQALYDVQTVVLQARPIALRRMAHLYPFGSKERLALEAQAEKEQMDAALTKFYGQFRGAGAQAAGARGGAASAWSRW